MSHGLSSCDASHRRVTFPWHNQIVCVIHPTSSFWWPELCHYTIFLREVFSSLERHTVISPFNRFTE